MAEQIPDAISQDALAALLNGRSTLPAVAFDRKNPCELGFLIAMLVQNSEEPGPSRGHLLHALMCLAVTLRDQLSREAAKSIARVQRPNDAFHPVFLTTLICLLKQIEDNADALLSAYTHQHGTGFDGSVSDGFLVSIGVSREDYEAFKEQACNRDQD